MAVAALQSVAAALSVVVKRQREDEDASAVVCAAPGTPKRKLRRLAPELSAPKEADPGQPRRQPEAEVQVKLEPAAAPPAEEAKASRPRGPPPQFTPADEDCTHDEHYMSELVNYRVHPKVRDPLLLQLRRWGPARTKQLVGLWAELGDGVARPVAKPVLQVCGAAGTGKTELVRGYLKAMNLRHVYLNACTCASLGELTAYMVEDIRRLAAATAPPAPREVQQPLPPGRQLRALDRIEAALRAPLEHLEAAARQHGGIMSDKVIVVVDNAQELPRLSSTALELLAGLPEALTRGRQLSFVFLSRQSFGQLGVQGAEPACIKFLHYRPREMEAILYRELARWLHEGAAGAGAVAMPSDEELKTLVGVGLMKFAAPVNNNLRELLIIGQEVLRQGVGETLAKLQKQVEEQLRRLMGLPDMAGLLRPGEGGREAAATTSTLRDRTQMAKRLILTSYIAARVDKENDMQLFLPEGRRRRLRRGSVVKKRPGAQEGPAFLRTPHAVPLRRLLAIYHRLARQGNVLCPTLLATLAELGEAGLLRVEGGKKFSVSRDPKVECTVDLQLAAACASDLRVDMAEFLCNSG